MISQDTDNGIVMSHDTKMDKNLLSNENNIHTVEITECPICMNIIELVKLPCGHMICENCRKGIYPDDTGKKNCPFCRETYETIINIKETRQSIIPRNTRVYIERERNHNTVYSYICCIGCVFATCMCLYGHPV